MKCAFKITGLSDLANKRVLSISVTDEMGTKSDKVQIRLDDRDYALETPQKGQKIEVFLGYEETGIKSLGTYELDEIKFLETQACTMEISGNAQEHVAEDSIKSTTEQPWDEKKLGEIFTEIAQRHGYTPDIHPDIASIYYDHLDQSIESDINFATRIAERHDAFVKIQDGKLIVKPRDKLEGLVYIQKGSKKQVSTSSLVVTIPCSITATASSRTEYDKVSATYYDVDSGEQKTESVGDGQREHKIRQQYETQDKAQAAAESKKTQLDRGKGGIDNLTCPGDPNVRAGMRLLLVGFRPDICGVEWKISSVTHTMDNGGYKLSLKAESELDVSGSMSGA